MKKFRQIIAIILLVVFFCLVGYTCHTCSRTTENLTQQEQIIGGYDET